MEYLWIAIQVTSTLGGLGAFILIGGLLVEKAVDHFRRRVPRGATFHDYPSGRKL